MYVYYMIVFFVDAHVIDILTNLHTKKAKLAKICYIKVCVCQRDRDFILNGLLVTVRWDVQSRSSFRDAFIIFGEFVS